MKNLLREHAASDSAGGHAGGRETEAGLARGSPAPVSPCNTRTGAAGSAGAYSIQLAPLWCFMYAPELVTTSRKEGL